jgi:cytochrome c biogenesis protein CcmG/thiol:disulfide interchange protein DsbE
MSGWRRFLLFALVGAAIAAALWFAFLRPSREATPAASGTGHGLVAQPRRRLLPDLSAAALTPPPARLSLRSDDGRPSFVDVWASWCIPCQEEAPMLARLHQKYGRAIRFLGIDVEDSRGAARAFERRHRIRYPSMFDRSASMADKLGFFGLPTAYLIDGRNRIAAVLAGRQTRSALETRLRRLLADGRRR